MKVPKRDLVATLLVALAALVWLLWASDSAVPGLGSARVAGAVVLALGFAASASAVVPGFAALLRGNKAYLAVTSIIGISALVGGLATLIWASAWGFDLMMAAMVLLWLISTVHHVRLTRTSGSLTCPNCRRPVRQLHCDVCGYDLIKQSRDRAYGPR